MPKSNFRIGEKMVDAFKLGIKDTLVFLGAEKMYPLSEPIDEAIVTCDSATYNGTNQIAQNITVTLSGVTLIEDVDYVVTSNTGGTNAGDYIVSVEGIDNYEGTANGTFTINKVTPTVTAPTPRTALVYNATSQQLINEATTDWGTLQYNVDGGAWATTVPSAINAKEYTVSYRVVGDSNINDVAAQSITSTINKVTPTVTAPTAKSLTYNGSAQALANVGSTNYGTLQYCSTESGTYSVSMISGTNAGNYDVWYRVVGDSNVNDVDPAKISVSIAKADPSYTAPTAKSLTYNTSAQELLNAGSTSDGTIQYSSDNISWSTTIPKGTNANTYTSYWKIIGDSNHNDKPSVSISTTISPKTVNSPTITLSPSSYTYNASACEPTPTVKDGSVTIASSEYTISYSNNTNAGTATCTITDKSGGNYVVNGSKTFTIAKVTPTVTAPTPKTLTFNNANQVLANAGSTNWGTIQYCLNNSGGTYSTTVPSASAANTTYKVWYKVVGNSNVNDVAPASIDCMIAEKRVTTPTITLDPTGYTYNGSECKPTPTVKDGSTVIPSSEYTTTYSNNVNAGTASVVISDKTAGNYYISGTTTFTIKKAAGSVTTKPTAKSLTYNNTEQALVTAGSGTGTMMYKLGSGSWGTSIPTSKNAGNYTVYYKASASTNYEESASGSVAVNIAKVTPTVTAPTAKSLTYNGSAQALVNAGSTNYGTLKYSTDGSTYSTSIPSGTNATSYTVYYRVDGDSNVNSVAAKTLSVTIAKADPTYNAPTKNDRTYDTTSKSLLNAGAVTGGTIYYSSNNVDWSTTIPSQTNAGTYTSYWKITGDSNHNDKASASISTTISPKTVSSPTITLSPSSYVWSNSECKPTPTVKDGSVTIATTEYTVGYSNNKAAGTATCSITDKSGGNYTVSGSKTFTISKYTPNAPTAKSLTYNGSAQALVNAGSTSFGTIVYCLNNSGGTYTTSVPTATNAGSYDVWWKLSGDTTVTSNCNNTATTKISCSIAKATMTYAAPKAAPRTYNGSAQQIVSGGSATGGAIYYATSSAGASSSTTVPTQTNAGSYTVYWKAIPDSNHTGGTSTWASISCSIAKAAMTYSAPKAAVRTYNGSAQQIVSGASAGGGSIQYCSTSGGTYTTTVPTQTNTGTSYSTWWKAVPDSNHSGGTNPAQVTGCAINKASLTITAKAQTINYGSSITTGTGQTTTSGLVSGDALTAITLTQSTTSVTTSGKITPSAGATTKGIGNYSVTYNTGTLVINKVAMTYSAPKAAVRTYNGSAQQIVSGASAAGGSIYYATSSAGASSSTTVPTQTNASTTYSTWWKAVPDSNHSGGTSSWAQITGCTINKANQSAPTATGATVTYHNTATATASGGGGQGTLTWTNGNTRTATGTTATAAYWAGNSNYNASPNSNSVNLVVNKATDQSITVTTTNRTYNTSSQVVASATAHGISNYYLGFGSSSTSAPSTWGAANSSISQTNAGTYYVWYKGTADGNHSANIGNTYKGTVTISKANISPTVSISNWTYGGTASNPSVAGNSGSGTVVYYYKLASASSWSTTKPSAAGSYNIRADISATTNYNSGTCTNNFTINKAAMSYSAPKAAVNTYNGSTQQIVSGASAGGGSIYYATSSAGASSSTTVPTQTNAGTYSTYWKAIPDSNHSGGTSTWAQITGCTINKASRTLSWTSKPNNLDKGETGTLTATPSAGSGDGSITYTSSNASVASISGSTITAKGAGTATITATIAAGTNYLSATTSYTITCTDKYNGHAYVDLGLPSGTKWATMNVGATSESGTGKYYQYGKGTTEYTYGSPIYTGTEVPLATSADTAAQVWGGSWHMPTQAQWSELIANTTFSWTTVGDVYGLKFTASNSKYVFLPAVGYKTSAVYGVGTQCQYLGSTKSWPSGAQETNYFYKLYYNIGGSPAVDEFGERTVGYPVRGVVG